MQRGLALVVFKQFWTQALYSNCVGHPMQNQCKAHATPILYLQDTDSIHIVWVWHGPTQVWHGLDRAVTAHILCLDCMVWFSVGWAQANAGYTLVGLRLPCALPADKKLLSRHILWRPTHTWLTRANPLGPHHTGAVLVRACRLGSYRMMTYFLIRGKIA